MRGSRWRNVDFGNPYEACSEFGRHDKIGKDSAKRWEGKMAQPLLIAKGEVDLNLLPGMANRHGLIAGSTGTGKTVSLQVLAEQFSRIGVPVFMADVKGDLSGISRPGFPNPRIADRIQKLGLVDFSFSNCPADFWDVFGEQGHPVRTTISEMGPLLLGRLLDLNETQDSVLTLIFKIADDSGLLLLDIKDLRAILQYAGENARSFTTAYGNISPATIGTIQRGLISLEEAGGGAFFGEPALSLTDFIQTGLDGRGVINILAADKLIQYPKIYAAFLLWLLAELFERLPEVGDLEKPRLVFFFDEAHLLFNDIPKALEETIERVVRLIRSKGVGVYFVSQNPLDLPDVVLGQLGNRIQHALRAFTPRDQKAVRAAADTFRSNPKIDVEKCITELGVGEALVSFLDEKGTPGVVDRAWICPPHSQIGPIDAGQRQQIIHGSIAYGRYEKLIDRESAYEKLKAKAEQRVASTMAPPKPAPPQRIGRQPDGVMEILAKSAARSIGSQVGRQIIRGVFGSLFGGR